MAMGMGCGSGMRGCPIPPHATEHSFRESEWSWCVLAKNSNVLLRDKIRNQMHAKTRALEYLTNILAVLNGGQAKMPDTERQNLINVQQKFQQKIQRQVNKDKELLEVLEQLIVEKSER
jgi:hypothetical protein